jgi:hypothetical protein
MMMKGSKMKTSLEVEGLLAGPPPTSAAANEEFTGPVQPSTGWDPYEVWRTRVKAAQDNPTTEATLA